MEQSVAEQAKSLLAVRALIGVAAFDKAKADLIEKLSSGDQLAQLMDLDGFLTADDVMSLAKKLTAASAPPPARNAAVLDSGLDTTTALALLIDDADLVARVNSIRKDHDSAFGRWMPHINFLFPFVTLAKFAHYGDTIGRAIETFGPFEVVLDSYSFFSQGKGKCTFNLQPSDDSKLQALFARVMAAVPEIKPSKDFHPHLTLGQCQKPELDSMLAKAKTAICEKVVLRVSHLSMISRSGKTDPFEIKAVLPLTPQERVPAVSGNNNNAIVEERPRATAFVAAAVAAVGRNDNNNNDNNVPVPVVRGGQMDSMLQLWVDGAQLLLLPQYASPAVDSRPYFVCADLKTAGENGSAQEDDQFVLIMLDVSSSMNHDQLNRYQAPDSPDHPDSSIKKARRVCSELAASSFQSGVKTVVVVPWFDRTGKPIKLMASDFKLEGTEDFAPDLLDQVLARLGEKAFVAGGATNLEAALEFASGGIVGQAQKVKNAQLHVWLITDGEPTYYNDATTHAADYIPTNKQDGRFAFFNHRDTSGLTQYELSLCKKLRESSDRVRELGGSASWHLVCFGEAEPTLMLALANSCDGRCHPVRGDLNVLIAEFKTNFKAAKISATLNGDSIKASVVDGVLFSRGQLTDAQCRTIIKSGRAVLAVENGPTVRMGGAEELRLEVATFGHIRELLGLEAKLADLMQASIREDSNTPGHLQGLKRIRMDLVGKLARQLRYPLLQSFLEQFLDSYLASEQALERILAQYMMRSEGEALSNVAGRLELLSAKERLALAAGVSSVRVGMGGFVKLRLDRQIAKIVAAKGQWGRQLLSRTCLLHRTDTLPLDEDKSETLVSLFVFDAGAVHRLRAVYAEKLGITDHFEWEETLRHDIATGHLMADVTIEKDGQVTERKGEHFQDIYTKAAETCHIRARTTDMAECEKQLLDPLSYASFLELIAEQGTLPAALYTVAPVQGPAVLFDAKELLRIMPGPRDGADLTSFSYFRLLQRLSGNEDGIKSIRVPGTFSESNFALPLACDPLSSRVISTCLVGLMSEPVTGTALAPLSEVGMFYAAFAYHHLRVAKPTDLDFSRIAQCLASLWFWLDNPRTNPSVKDMEDTCERMFAPDAREIAKSDAPGAVPIRAFVFGLLDVKTELSQKGKSIMRECAMRGLRFKFEDSKVRLDFFRSMIERLSGERLQQPAGEESAAFAVPANFFAVAEELAAAVNAQKLDLFFEKHKPHIVAVLRDVYTTLQYWSSVHQTFRNWTFVHTFMSRMQLAGTFGAYKSPQSMVDKCVAASQGAVDTDNVLWSWAGENGSVCFLTFDNGGALREQMLRCNRKGDWNVESRGDGLSPEGTEAAIAALQAILSLHSWTGNPSSAFGLSPIDFMIVEALLKPELVAKLNAMQLSTLQKAKEHREACRVYFPWVPKKVALPKLEGNLVRVEMKPRGGDSKKPRTACCIIGDVDHGKSSLVGHLLYDCGEIPDRLWRQIEKQAEDLNKGSFKFAWIMDKLREERERGVTIQWKLWTLSSANHEIDIIDTPGHASFVKNMAVGASLADAAVVVVSAAKAEFEMAWSSSAKNTQREILMCASIGMKRWVFAINKMDTCENPEQRFNEICDEIRHTVQKKYGIQPEQLCFIPISAWLGWNLTTNNACEWWKGTTVYNLEKEATVVYTLFEAMDAAGSALGPRPVEGAPLRMPLVASYKIQGVGTVLSGRLLSGSVAVGDEVAVVGVAASVKVKSIEIFHSSRQRAMAGDVVGIAVAVPLKDVNRGMVVCGAKDNLRSTTCFTAQLRILPQCLSLIKAKYRPFAFCCTATFAVQFEAILKKVDKAGKVIEENPRECRAGDIVVVRMSTECPVTLEEFPSPLGRFLIRDNGETIAIGRVHTVEAQQPKAPAAAAVVMKKGKHFK